MKKFKTAVVVRISVYTSQAFLLTFSEMSYEFKGKMGNQILVPPLGLLCF